MLLNKRKRNPGLIQPWVQRLSAFQQLIPGSIDSIGSFGKFFRGKLFMPSHNALRNVNKDGGVFQMCGCVHFVKFLCKEENVTG